jgi:hypothetical protein
VSRSGSTKRSACVSPAQRRKSPDHLEAFMHFPSERRVELVIAGLIDATGVGSNRSVLCPDSAPAAGLIARATARRPR